MFQAARLTLEVPFPISTLPPTSRYELLRNLSLAVTRVSIWPSSSSLPGHPLRLTWGRRRRTTTKMTRTTRRTRTRKRARTRSCLPVSLSSPTLPGSPGPPPSCPRRNTSPSSSRPSCSPWGRKSPPAARPSRRRPRAGAGWGEEGQEILGHMVTSSFRSTRCVVPLHLGSGWKKYNS